MNDEDAEAALHRYSSIFLTTLGKLKGPSGAGIDDIAITPLMEAWVSALGWADNEGLEPHQAGAIANSADNAFQAYKQYLEVAGSVKATAFAGVRGQLEIFEAIFEELEAAGRSSSDFESLRSKISEASDESQRAVGVMAYVTQRTAGLDKAIEQAQEAATKAKSILDLVQKLTTEGATSELERSFETTAKGSAKVANFFLWATVTMLIGTAIIGLVFVNQASTAHAVEWHSVVYRIAILSALAAVAAYLGRQASQYRRIANWALGIEIQLKAFRGFVNEIDDPEARQTMFSLFGKRVLEAPPDGKSSNDEVTNVIQPIIEQATRFKSPGA